MSTTPENLQSRLAAKIAIREANQTIKSAKQTLMSTSQTKRDGAGFTPEERQILKSNGGQISAVFAHRQSKAEAAAPELLKELQGGGNPKMNSQEQSEVLKLVGKTRSSAPSAGSPKPVAAPAPATAAKPAPVSAPAKSSATGLDRVRESFAKAGKPPAKSTPIASKLTGHAKVSAAFRAAEKSK